MDAIPQNPTAAAAKKPGAKEFLDQLFGAGVLTETGVDGVYGRSGDFEEVIERFLGLVSALGAPTGRSASIFRRACRGRCWSGAAI